MLVSPKKMLWSLGLFVACDGLCCERFQNFLIAYCRNSSSTNFLIFLLVEHQISRFYRSNRLNELWPFERPFNVGYSIFNEFIEELGYGRVKVVS
jgi:hypothetical protein